MAEIIKAVKLWAPIILPGIALLSGIVLMLTRDRTIPYDPVTRMYDARVREPYSKAWPGLLGGALLMACLVDFIGGINYWAAGMNAAAARQWLGPPAVSYILVPLVPLIFMHIVWALNLHGSSIPGIRVAPPDMDLGPPPPEAHPLYNEVESDDQAPPFG